MPRKPKLIFEICQKLRRGLFIEFPWVMAARALPCVQTDVFHRRGVYLRTMMAEACAGNSNSTAFPVTRISLALPSRSTRAIAFARDKLLMSNEKLPRFASLLKATMAKSPRLVRAKAY